MSEFNAKIHHFQLPPSICLDIPGCTDQNEHCVPLHVPYEMITAADLHDMCQEFRREVFERAGKEDPYPDAHETDWKPDTND